MVELSLNVVEVLRKHAHTLMTDEHNIMEIVNIYKISSWSVHILTE